ncbi:hypothetical protein N7466_010304 [Penicillium verhagenii]|uniref:uncharacterized protein n=1 Tax=Penicillium verhagenii TaxID=1562060 RepID=UPI002544FF12|nr:uncharacterized protein N7466_010304 [Penicillium verhagenii]KAJ5919361.1 hypothetical protein N7466_010304 [Penicillium verhagenii]
MASSTSPRVLETAPRQSSELPTAASLGSPYIPFQQKSIPNFSLEIPLLLFHDADTLLYIDPPPEDGPKNLASTPTIPLRVHSEKFLKIGSAYFEKLFTLRNQKRVRKQRGFADKLPMGIKYVVDLTPAIHEEDAIIALTEVSCPMAIRKWASLKEKWKLPESCVGGEDEYQILEHLAPAMLAEPLVVSDGSEEIQEEDLDEQETGIFTRMSAREMVLRNGLPVEYSAARHRQGIEYVLHVLEGLSITLDTPCKLWTFFAVAKLFNVATLPVISGYIISWFYEANNTRLIEIHPEVAYRVGLGIKSSELCRHAFMGLVSDEALLYLIRSANLTPLKMYKQKFEKSPINDNLDDNEVQRIEYASKAFMDTIIKHFLHLAGEEMPWIEDSSIPEVTKLTQHARIYPEDAEDVKSVIDILKESVRASIYSKLSISADPMRCAYSKSNSQGHRFSHPRAFEPQDFLVRLMGRSFWTELISSRVSLTLDLIQASRTNHDIDMHRSIADIGCGLLAFQGQENAQIRMIARHTLDEKIRGFNEMAVRRAEEQHDMLNQELKTRSNRWNLTINLRRRTPRVNEPVDSSSNHVSSTTKDMKHSPSMETTLPERPKEKTNPFISQQPSQRPSFPVDLSQYDASYSQPDMSNRANDYYDYKHFDEEAFTMAATAYISRYSRAILNTSERTPFQHHFASIITCLTDNEYRYLPLWAGGDDDETGGVFTDQDIPIMTGGGFSAPGPAVHTGSVASTNDSFSEINPSDSQSTVQGASHHATHSHVSDIASMESYDELEDLGSVENLHQQHSSETMQANPDYGYAISSVKSDDEDYDAYSAGGSTVVMGSPHLSGFSDDDMDIDLAENDEDEFDMVEDVH